jgi:hypothetical protein
MVRLAATFVFTAALALATVRAQEAGAETVEEVLSRDVSSTESDLFGRAAAKVMNDLFSREELSEVYGRDFDGDLTWRDVTELVERESIDMSEVEELAARAAAPQEAPDEPKPKGETKPKGHSVFGQVLQFFNRLIHPKPKAGTTDAAKGKGKDAHSKAGPPAAHKKDEKPAAKEEKAPPKEDAPAPAPEGGAEEGAEEARDFLESFLEEPVERSLQEEIEIAERSFISDDEALEVRELLDAAELELEARELIEDALELEARELLEDALDLEARELIEDSLDLEARDLMDEALELEARDLLDNAALELEVRELLDNAELELAERSFDDEDLLEARDLLEEYADLLERDFDEDLLERDVEEDLFEREGEWDDELLRRAFDIVEELEMLD